MDSSQWNSDIPTLKDIKCRASGGVASLRNGKYEEAARLFVECDFKKVITPSDAAIFGSLSALATFDCAELKQLVLDSESFQQFLDFEPKMHEALQDFRKPKFRSTLKILNEIRTDLISHLYLGVYVDNLLTKIRNRAYVEYFSPYTRVDMPKMATEFEITIDQLENELCELIEGTKTTGTY